VLITIVIKKFEKIVSKQCFTKNRILAEFIQEKINGKKTGFGIKTWKDGARYIGTFTEDKANGIGGFEHSDGDYYTGKE